MPGEDESLRNPVFLGLHCPWCNKAEGSTVTIGISSYRWRIHKCLLVRKSAYFEQRMLEEAEHLLPSGFPGGAAALDAVVSFCFDAGVGVMRASNVAALRCAAEFLGMDEQQSVENLAHRADTYLGHVVFRSWEDTLIVLAECQALLPLAEELNIVWRCVEAISSMVAASSKEMGWWWIEDVVTMPAAFFARVVRALRKKGIGERSVGELIVKFSDRWLFSSSNCDHDNSNNQRFLLTNSSSSSLDDDDDQADARLERNSSTESSKDDLELVASSTNCSSSDRDESSEHHICSNDLQLGFHDDDKRTTEVGVGGFENKLALLEAIAELLPYEKTAVPISFLFLLLRYAFAMDSSSECKSEIESRISLQLENATLDDFLMPFKSPSKEKCKLNFELDSMRQIVAKFLSQQHRSIVSAKNEFRSSAAAATNMHLANAAIISQQQQQQQAVFAVVKVWDEYLGEIACDANIPPEKFTELVEVVPAYARGNHDQLYKAIQIFFKAHAEISPQERATVCRALNCLKLSQEVCIQAVQNELMPLRMIVQAMFVQQLQTRNAISTHLRAVTSSPMQMQQQQLEKHATTQMKMNHAFEDGARKNSNVMEDLQETTMRLQSLEATMAGMKKSLRESSKTRLSDFDLSCNDHQKKGDENCSCISSSSSSSHTPNDGNKNNNINKEKRRFFLKKSCSSRGNRSSRGVARISRLFHKMGILSFCRAANKNFPESSFKELPCTKKLPCRASTGCIPIEDDDKTVSSSSKDGKTSWDDVDGCDRYATDASNRIIQQHLRHHSIA